MPLFPLITRYIGRQVLLLILGTGFVLWSIEFLFELSHQLKWMGQGDYHLRQMLLYLLLIAPNQWFELWPWATLLGTILAFTQLAQQSELVVLRTGARMSLGTFSRQVLFFLAPFFALFLAFGEWIGPEAEQLAHTLKTQWLSSGHATENKGRLWLKHRDRIYYINLYQKDKEGSMHLHQVEMLAPNAHWSGLKSWTSIESATLSNGHWDCRHLMTLSLEQDPPTVLQRSRVLIDVDDFFPAKWLQDRTSHRPEKMPLRDLWSAWQNKVEQHLDARDFSYGFFKRLFQPVLASLMVWVSIPWLFASTRQPKWGFQVAIGLGMGYTFHILWQLLNHGFFQMNAAPYCPALLLTLLMIGGGLWKSRF